MPHQDQNELKKRVRSFRYAFDGWSYVLRTQRNAWIHAAAAVAVVFLAFWLEVSRLEWSILILAITIVWTAEFANTALEAVVDLVSPQEQPLARVAKDVAAGAVLVSACGAAVVGLLILGPPLWDRLAG